MSKKWLLSVSLAASVSVLAACGSGSTGAEESKPETTQSAPAPNTQGESGQPKMPKPDLSGVPDTVATVNGEEIPKKQFVQMYKTQFQQMAMQSQMSGQKVDQGKLKGQVADGLVGTELLIQEAEKRDLKASDKAVDAKLDELAKSNKLGSADKLLAALEKQKGMGEEQVRSQIQTQVKVEQLVSEETGNIKPTEAELKDAYKKVKAQQAQMGGGSGSSKIPSFEKVRGQLADQLKSQEQAKVTQALVKDLREDANVKVNL